MVAADAVAGVGDLKHHHLHAGEVRLQVRAPAALAEDSRRRDEPSIRPDLELDGGFATTLLVVDAHGRLEGEGVAAHRHDELAHGVRAETVLVDLAVHAEESAVDRARHERQAVAARHRRAVDVLDPHAALSRAHGRRTRGGDTKQ